MSWRGAGRAVTSPEFTGGFGLAQCCGWVLSDSGLWSGYRVFIRALKRQLCETRMLTEWQRNSYCGVGGGYPGKRPIHEGGASRDPSGA